MTFRVHDGQGAQALDFNQHLSRLLGRGVIQGGAVTSSAGKYAVTVEAVEVYLNGEHYATSEIDLDLSTYVDDDLPRKVLLYVDSGGEVVVAPGEPEEIQPSDQFRWDCFRPAPPDLSSTDAVVLAEVWLDPDDILLTDADIRDRRLEANVEFHRVDADIVDVEELIDGAGVSHTGQLAGDDVVFTEEDVRTAIDTDPYHGADAPHNYFSGSHTDLTNVSTDDHHSRFTDAEARDAVRGELDAADLTGDSGTSGQFIEFTGSGLSWSDPPQQQATVVNSGTFAHTGGSSTTETLTSVTTDETAQIEVAFGVDSDPGWNADYGFSVSISRQWDDTNGELDVGVTVDWTTDPGSGNDLTLAWTAYDTSPVVVEGRYTDADAVNAIDGSVITPDEANIASRLNAPVYDDVSTITGMEKGDIVIASGDGPSTFGQYLYNDSEWVGPLGTSVTSLSDLTIDTDKDWNGYSINGLGAPNNPNDAVRYSDLTNHEGTADAHHAQTTSSDIDHSQVTNVQSDQHHSRYTDTEAREAAVGQVHTSALTGASIPNGEYLQNFHHIQTGETMTVVRSEVIDENGTVPSGLLIQLYDMDSGTTVYQSSSLVNSGSPSSPLETVSGEATVAIRIYNNTGSEVAASGSMSFEIS